MEEKEKLTIDKLRIQDKIDNFFMISDIHLGLKNGSEQWRDNMQDYFENWFIPFLKSHKTSKSALFVLGDIFDDRKSINIAINDLAINIFTEIGKIIPTYIINGNHDLYKKSDNSITSLKSLENIRGMHMLKNPTLMEISKSKQIPSGPGETETGTEWSKKLMFIPYQGNNEKETKLCEKEKNADYIFMHTDIKGLRYDNGRDISLAADISSAKGKVYSGHIHKRQETEKAVYIGSPYQMRRSDINNQKGIYQILLPSGERKFFENKYSPIFQKISFSSLLDKTYREVKEICSNNYTDILIDEDELPKISISKLYEILEPCDPKRIEIKTISKDQLFDDEDENDFKEKSIPDIIDSLIDTMDLEKEKKQELKNLSLKYQELSKTVSEED